MRAYTMTWEGAKARWRKMFKGSTYTISCKELGCPATKEESYRAANSWWRIKHAQIMGYTPTNPIDTVIDIHRFWEEWASNRFPQVAQNQAQTIEFFRSITMPPDVAQRMADVMTKAMDKRTNPEETPLPPSHTETIGYCVNHWLGVLRSRVEFHKLSVSRFASCSQTIGRFQKWAGQDTPVTAINEDLFSRYYQNIGNNYVPDSTRKTHMTNVKAFLNHVYEMKLIELPRNMKSSELRYSVDATPISTFTIAQIKTLLQKATGQGKLHILLALNCGMGAEDIATLKQSDIDWTNGIVCRKRSKTAKHKNTPKVSYHLWGETLRLLTEFNTGQSPVLLTKKGEPWAGSGLTEDGSQKTNKIASLFSRIAVKCGIKGSHYMLRRSSATLLETHEIYGRYVGLFLGHSPATEAERSYATPSAELFDAAIKWLGEQFGV